MTRATPKHTRLRLAIAVTLLLGVAIDAWCLPPRRSTVGGLLHPVPNSPLRGGTWPEWNVVYLDGQWVAMSPEEFLALEPGLAGDDPQFTVTHRRRYSTRGLWAPTHQRRLNDLRFANGQGPDVEPPARARQVAAAYLRDELGIEPSIADPLAVSDLNEIGMIWAGWLHNLLALLAFVGALVVMPWRAIATGCRRFVRGRRPGHCAACGYDLAGLPENRCPECGERTGPADSIPAKARLAEPRG